MEGVVRIVSVILLVLAIGLIVYGAFNLMLNKGTCDASNDFYHRTLSRARMGLLFGGNFALLWVLSRIVIRLKY